MQTLSVPSSQPTFAELPTRPRDRLVTLLNENLDFHDQDSGYASHNFHAFPAKFPPQLPRKFIQGLTAEEDVVLDPMMGSGTTIVEAYLAGRKAVGFDIDPLALRLAQSKVAPLDNNHVAELGATVLEKAAVALEKDLDALEKALKDRFDEKTKQFIDYWFMHGVQLELIALLREIQSIPDSPEKDFLEMVFSAIIITKSGGVSNALDLAHTRPHHAKVVIDQDNQVVLDDESFNGTPERRALLTKKLRSPFIEFGKRLQVNVQGILAQEPNDLRPTIDYADCQHLPLRDESIDLIVTSPPYASNAIDYMRAHKFSLVWLGHSISELGQKRRTYIGGESITDTTFQDLPTYTTKIVATLSELDRKKSRVLHRYYSEMTRSLAEIFRVLRPEKSAIVVVGSSVMRGIDTETEKCLAEIGERIGFEVPTIGVRQLDRDRRMLPAGIKRNKDSQIQQRMHEEYVIGFYKPCSH